MHVKISLAPPSTSSGRHSYPANGASAWNQCQKSVPLRLTRRSLQIYVRSPGVGHSAKCIHQERKTRINDGHRLLHRPSKKRKKKKNWGGIKFPVNHSATASAFPGCWCSRLEIILFRVLLYTETFRVRVHVSTRPNIHARKPTHIYNSRSYVYNTTWLDCNLYRYHWCFWELKLHILD